MSTLAINAGSSSLKFGLFDDLDATALVTGEMDWADGKREQAQLIVRPRQGTTVKSRFSLTGSDTAAARVVQVALAAVGAEKNSARAITAVGHRIVHGGAEYRESVLLDSKV